MSEPSDGVPSASSTPSSSIIPSTVTPDELAWLRRCLPIFVQPQVDVDNGNGLVKVFFRFERDDATARLDCKLCIVFAGEASYNRIIPARENCIATLFYRTFNRRTYKRTADINYMEFHNVDLTLESSTPWASVFTVDHGGEQTWAQGDKADVCCWFSLMHHYREDVGYAEWHKDGHRPLVYLNTCNHMIGERDNNASLAKREWSDYAFQLGDAEDAFHYAVAHVPTKCNLYSLCCFWKATNGGHDADGLLHDFGHSGRQGVASTSRQSIYLQVPATTKASDEKAKLTSQ